MASKKLLVADDSLTIQKVIRLALTNEGYDIHAVSDGNHALQQIATFRPDIVIIDVSLPVKSAFEVKREINETEDRDAVKFILMSSAFEKVDEAQLEEVSFHARLTKPFDPAQLRQILADAIHFSSSDSKPGATSLPPFPILPFEMESPPEMPLSFDSEIHRQETPSTRRDSWQESLSDPFANFQIREANSDLLMPPTEPHHLPPLPSDSNSDSKEDAFDLWEISQDRGPHASHTLQSSESDIKQLAEITLAPKASHDLDWNLSDHLPNLDFPPPDLPAIPELELPPQMTSPVSPPPFKNSKAETKQSEPAKTKTTPPIKPQEHTQPLASNVSSENLDKMIQEQIKASLEKMAKNLLPSIAEKVIKEEIHRLLTETEAKPS